MMKLLGNTVLLEPLNPLLSRGGLHLIERYQDNKQFRVVAVGPGRRVRKKGKADRLETPEVQPGDHVLLNQYYGNKFAFDDGTGRILVEAADIEAKWRPGTTYPD